MVSCDVPEPAVEFVGRLHFEVKIIANILGFPDKFIKNAPVCICVNKEV